MKNAFAQLQLLVAKVDPRYLQVAFAFALIATKVACGPVDGGTGPF